MTTSTNINPYKDTTTNLIYNLLFCDDIELYKTNTQPPYAYPYDVLFSDDSTVDELQKIVDTDGADTRLKILAYNKQVSKGYTAQQKDLLAVIIEVGLENGLDVLASFQDGTARYINQTGKIVIWEAPDDASFDLTLDLFEKSFDIIKRIGAWDKPRRPHPATDMVRITFLVSDGIYFGEGPMHVLFNDPMAGPALSRGTQLMSYIVSKASS